MLRWLLGTHVKSFFAAVGYFSLVRSPVIWPMAAVRRAHGRVPEVLQRASWRSPVPLGLVPCGAGWAGQQGDWSSKQKDEFVYLETAKKSWKVGRTGEGSTPLDKVVEAGLFEKAPSELRPERPEASHAELWTDSVASRGSV